MTTQFMSFIRFLFAAIYGLLSNPQAMRRVALVVVVCLDDCRAHRSVRNHAGGRLARRRPPLNRERKEKTIMTTNFMSFVRFLFAAIYGLLSNPQAMRRVALVVVVCLDGCRAHRPVPDHAGGRLARWRPPLRR